MSIAQEKIIWEEQDGTPALVQNIFFVRTEERNDRCAIFTFLYFNGWTCTHFITEHDLNVIFNTTIDKVSRYQINSRLMSFLELHAEREWKRHVEFEREMAEVREYDLNSTD